MNLEQLRNYCLSKPATSEGFPYDASTLVFKVAEKQFALVDADEAVSVNLKCDPELAVELRERYAAVTPGYHMNKKHWNTVALRADVPDHLIYEWIDHSYNLVMSGLPKKTKLEFGLG